MKTIQDIYNIYLQCLSIYRITIYTYIYLYINDYGELFFYKKKIYASAHIFMCRNTYIMPVIYVAEHSFADCLTQYFFFLLPIWSAEP